MRYLYAVLFFIFGSAASAQTVSFTLRAGVTPFVPPAAARAYDDCKARVTPFVGLKLAFENEVAQVGLGVDRAELNYKYVNTYDVRSKISFVNPHFSVNFKTKPEKQFVYLGMQAGLLFPLNEKLLIEDVAREVKPDKDATPGFTLGTQIGGQIEMGSRFFLCFEGAVRYAGISTKIYGRQPYYGWNVVGGTNENTSMFFFPLTIGLKYEI